MPDTPAHIALAERLGYRRAWVYDTPAPAAAAYESSSDAPIRRASLSFA